MHKVPQFHHKTAEFLVVHESRVHKIVTDHYEPINIGIFVRLDSLPISGPALFSFFSLSE